MPFQTSTNMYTYSRYIVGDGSPYTTIQMAINAANLAGGGTILIRPGVYVENLTLYTLVNLEGAAGTEYTGGVTITGVHTPPVAGNISFKRITFTSATDIFNSGAAGTTSISLESCIVNCTDGYVFNLIAWTGAINVDDVFTRSTSDGFLNCASTAAVYVINSSVGAGVVRNLRTTGTIGFYNSAIQCISAFQTNADAIFKNCTVTYTANWANNATGRATDTAFLTGVLAAINTTSASPVVLENVTIDSSAASVITGTGNITFGSVTYITNTAIAGTITKDFTTRLETGVLKVADATVGVLNATAGVVAGLGAMTNGQLVIGSTGVAPAISTLTAGAGIAITNAAGAITITNTGAGAAWNFTAVNVANMVPDNGYVCIAPGGALTLGLPAVAAQGSELEVSLDGATSWQITQAGGQRILLGDTQTTLGAGGSIASTKQGDTIRLLCVTANARWVALSFVGNLTIV